MATLTCVDCRQTFERISNEKRCLSCSRRRTRERATEWARRTRAANPRWCVCIDCASPFIGYRGQRIDRCKPCGATRKRQRGPVNLLAQRERLRRWKVKMKTEYPDKLRAQQRASRMRSKESIIRRKDDLRFNGNRIRALERDNFSC